MIHVEEFDDRPLQAGDTRTLVLSGNGPFLIQSRCFVDQPRPPGPGFLPCPECEAARVESMQPFNVKCSTRMWRRATGRIEIHIRNSTGESLVLSLQVTGESDQGLMMGGA